MKILYLGPESPLVGFLGAVQTEDEITPEFAKDFDWLVSFGYRHILKKDILDLFPDRAINCHISFLPWNRGADPNLWSFLEDTPKGVTIHYMDEGLDTGDIICQWHYADMKFDTLATSYTKLQHAMIRMFKFYWEDIKDGNVGRKKQGDGSYHCLKDKDKYEHLLTRGYDTPVSELINKAASERLF